MQLKQEYTSAEDNIQKEETAAEEKEKQRIYRYNRRACGKPEWKYENRIGNSRKHNGKCKKGMK